MSFKDWSAAHPEKAKPGAAAAPAKKAARPLELPDPPAAPKKAETDPAAGS